MESVEGGQKKFLKQCMHESIWKGFHDMISGTIIRYICRRIYERNNISNSAISEEIRGGISEAIRAKKIRS